MKRLMTIFAALAVANLVAALGAAAYAASRGWLTPERLRRAAEVLVAVDTEVSPPTTTMMSVSDRERPKPTRVADSAADETARIELDRRRREIQDGWAMLERQQLAFVQAAEAFEAEKKRHAREQEQRQRETGTSGFQKEMEILSGLKAKNAKDLLRLKADADVVRILSALDAQKARKIVSECKNSEDRLWIGRILEQLHERNATQAEVLGAGT